MTTVKEAKEKLTEILNELNSIDENKLFNIDICDNCGGSYIGNINDWELNNGEFNVWLNVE